MPFRLLKRWADYSKIRSLLHNRTGIFLGRVYYFIGFSNVICASVSAVTQFVDFCTDDTSWPPLKTTTALFAVFASMFSGFQTFSGFDKTSNQHLEASAKYDCIRRNIEEHIITLDEQGEINKGGSIELISKVKEELNNLSQLGLSVPKWIENQCKNDIDDALSDLTILSSPRQMPIQERQSIEEQKQPEKSQISSQNNDFQDEFTEAVREKLKQRQTNAEAFQLSRLNTECKDS